MCWPATKTCLGGSPNPNAMRSRHIAPQISEPQPLSMESIDFRKFGGRNLEAICGPKIARTPRKFSKPPPSRVQPMRFPFVPWRVSAPVETKEVNPTSQNKTLKKLQRLQMRNLHAQIDEGAPQTARAHCKARPPHTKYSATNHESQYRNLEIV